MRGSCMVARMVQARRMALGKTMVMTLVAMVVPADHRHLPKLVGRQLTSQPVPRPPPRYLGLVGKHGQLILNLRCKLPHQNVQTLPACRVCPHLLVGRFAFQVKIWRAWQHWF